MAIWEVWVHFFDPERGPRGREVSILYDKGTREEMGSAQTAAYFDYPEAEITLRQPDKNIGGKR